MKQRIKEDREYIELMNEIRWVMKKLEGQTTYPGEKLHRFKSSQGNAVFM